MRLIHEPLEKMLLYELLRFWREL